MFVTNQAPLTPSVLGHTRPTPSQWLLPHFKNSNRQLLAVVYLSNFKNGF